MSTPIKTGWLKDNSGDKFAPKTLSSQVQTVDGILLEDKLQDDLNAAKAEILDSITKNIDMSVYETKEDAQDKLAEAQAYTDSKVSTLGALAKKSTVTKSDLEESVQNSLDKADNALQSYTEIDPTVPAWAKAASKPSYSKSEVGLGNVDNVKQYSANNPPPYPVTSVNGKTGAVQLAANDVGAASKEQFEQLSEAIADYDTNISELNDKVTGLIQLEAPKIVMSLDEMTDMSKHYILDNYIYAWMKGNDGEISPNFKNLANLTSEEWKTGYRINSSFQYVENEPNSCSNFISFTKGDIIRLKGIYLSTTGTPTAGNGYAYSRFITSNDGITITGSVQISSVAPEASVTENGIETIDTSKIDGIRGDTHFIICGVVEDPDNVIITVNEEITYSADTSYAWRNTGMKYTSTIYTDIVGVLGENNVIYLSDNNLPSGEYVLKYQDDDYATIGTYIIK